MCGDEQRWTGYGGLLVGWAGWSCRADDSDSSSFLLADDPDPKTGQTSRYASPRLSVVANGSYYGVIPVGFDAVGCTGKVVRVGFRVRVAGARV